MLTTFPMRFYDKGVAEFGEYHFGLSARMIQYVCFESQKRIRNIENPTTRTGHRTGFQVLDFTVLFCFVGH